MTSKYRKIQQHIEKLRESDIRVRSMSYSGKGRPKKSDYKIIKFKDLMDFKCYERLKFGVIPFYTKN